MPGDRVYLAFLSILFLLLSTICAHDIYTRGEGREALVAQNMLNTGNWILPEGYSGDIPSKPPLLHWFIAGFSSFKGEITGFTARLPSALFSFLFLIYFYKFLSKEFTPKTALLSVLFLFLSVEWFRASGECRVDMLLSASLSCGLIELYKWARNGFSYYPKLAMFALTLATLAKGPVAVALAALIFSTYLLSSAQTVKKIVCLNLMVFIPVMLFSSLWYLAAFYYSGGHFLDKVYYENVSRFLGMMEDTPHKHNALYMFMVLILGFMPWSLFCFTGFFSFFKSANLKGEIKSIKATFRELPEFYKFSLIVFGIVVVFFSIPDGKRSVYLLPAYPFLSLIFSEFSIKSFDLKSQGCKFMASLFAVFVMVFLLLISGFMTGITPIPSTSTVTELQKIIYQLPLTTLILFVFAILLTFIFALRCSKATSKGLWINFLLLTACLYFLINGVCLSVLNRNLSPRGLTAEINEVLKDSRQLYSYDNEFYALSLYTGRRIDRIPESPVEHSEVLLFSKKIEEFRSKYGKYYDIEVRYTSSRPFENLARRLMILKLKKI